jgi:hypothetical protein
MVKRNSLAALLFALVVVGFASRSQAQPAQGGSPQPPQQTLPDAALESFNWRSIGPANMSGRITAVAVYEKDPSTWWAATASGGLVKTTNNGNRFEHQFDKEATVSIGDVAVSQSDPNIVWVGGGEANPRNSSTWGDGVYKSTDGGKTWKNMGLKKIFQTGRILIHPTDPNIVYVGALGRLWGPNEERGFFKTTNGGETWEKILYIDDKTGVVDAAMDPNDPDTILVATYERKRDGFDGNDPEVKFGAGAGIHRTTDGGKTFTKVTDGLPTVKMGRIGLSIYRKDPKIVYAVIETEKIGQRPENAAFAGLAGENADVGARITSVTADSPAAKAGLKEGDIVISVDGTTIHSNDDLTDQVWRHKAGDKVKLELSREREKVEVELTFAQYPPEGRGRGGRGGEAGGGGGGRGGARGGRGGGNPFTGALGGQSENRQNWQGEEGHNYGGVYRSENGGQSWKRINTLNPRPMYFSKIRVDPSDDKYVYILGVSQYRSSDGGKTFSSQGIGNAHADNHALWIDPTDGRHMIMAGDGGIYVTWDRMNSFDHHNHVAIGQFYHVSVSSNRNYRVFGGLQDNQSWGGPSRTRTGRGPGNTDWFQLGGGDGFLAISDPNDPDQIYYESQNGAMGRIHLKTGEGGAIRPTAAQGQTYRFNWKTPFMLSPHNSTIFYSAGNYVFRSVFKGNNMRAISPEITTTENAGAGSAIVESPLEEGVLLVGTTDGNVWSTRNGGADWVNVFDNPDQMQQPARGGRRGRGGRGRRGGPRGEAGQRGEAPRGARGGEATETGEGQPAAGQQQPAQQTERSQTEDVQIGQPRIDDIVTGRWTGRLTGTPLPEGPPEITFVLRMDQEGNVTGTFQRGTGEEGAISNGRYDVPQRSIRFTTETGQSFEFNGTITERRMTGQFTVRNTELSGNFEAQRALEPQPGQMVQADAPAGKPLKELVPGKRWVSSLHASKFAAARFYMTLDGHRSDDDEPYLFVSEDYGRSWRSLRANLSTSAGTTHVLREDLVNENVLYLGCEFSAWVSIDRGKSWTKFNNNLPTVAVHEFAIHPTAGEIVAATHGRSLWIGDVTHLRQLSEATLAADANLYKPNAVVRWRREQGRGSAGTRVFQPDPPPTSAQIYYSLGRNAQSVELTIANLLGEVMFRAEGETTPGLHLISWNTQRQAAGARGGGAGGGGRGRGPRGGAAAARRGGGGGGGGGRGGRGGGGGVPTGSYLVTLNVDGQTFKQELAIDIDPDLGPAILTENGVEFVEEMEAAGEDDDEPGDDDDHIGKRID